MAEDRWPTDREALDADAAAILDDVADAEVWLDGRPPYGADDPFERWGFDGLEIDVETDRVANQPSAEDLRRAGATSTGELTVRYDGREYTRPRAGNHCIGLDAETLADGAIADADVGFRKSDRAEANLVTTVGRYVNRFEDDIEGVEIQRDTEVLTVDLGGDAAATGTYEADPVPRRRDDDAGTPATDVRLLYVNGYVDEFLVGGERTAESVVSPPDPNGPERTAGAAIVDRIAAVRGEPVYDADREHGRER